MEGIDRPKGPPKAVLARAGALAWVLLHALSQHWPCPHCRPQLTKWMEGLHDAVNVRLGRPLFRDASFGRFARGELEGGYHRTCLGCRVLRPSLRLVARAPRGQGATPRYETPVEVRDVGHGNGVREEERP